METNLVLFTLRRTGAGVVFAAEPASDGPQTFSMHGLHFQRLRYESEALRALERVGIGSWSRFPDDAIQATVTRDELRALGFRGYY